jgi:type VI secretion system protein
MTSRLKTVGRYLLRLSQRTGVILMLAAISGCAMVGGAVKAVASSTTNLFSGPPGMSLLDWKSITLVAASDVNQNSPVALDMVLVRDEATLGKLLTLSASKWFSSKEELMKTYPNTMNVRSWELVPQQVLQLGEGALGSQRVAGILLYANYLSLGEHRAQLPQTQEALLVELGARGFTLQTRPR